MYYALGIFGRFVFGTQNAELNISREEAVMKLKVVVATVMLLVLAGPALALNRIVPLQYPDIQSAIDAAQGGDEVVVLQSNTPQGTWTGPGNVDLNFNNFTGNTLVVRSNINVSNPSPQVIANTIIDCGGTRYSPHRAFVFGPGEVGKNITITGFTIQNGYWVETIGEDGAIPGLSIDPDDPNGSPPRANSGEDASGDSFGGSILFDTASPTIEYCIIKNSTVTGAQGGDGDPGQWGTWLFISPDPSIEPEWIDDGQWGGHGGHGEGNGYGGAIACVNGAGPTIRHCNISDNFARGGCGGNGGDGGWAANLGADGAESWGGNAGDAGAIRDPMALPGDGSPGIQGTKGDGFGGGIYSDPTSNPIVSDCIFRNNIATWGLPGTGGDVGQGDALTPPAEPGRDGVAMPFWGISGGAAYHDLGSNPNYSEDCEFIENKAYGSTSFVASGRVITTYLYNEGGAVYAVGGSSISFDNCSFTKNLGGAVYIGPGCNTTIESCTFTENTDTDNGGAIFVDEGLGIEIHDSTFNGNSAYDDGGALDLKDHANLTNCTFGGNTANSTNDAIGDGGAINANHPGTTLMMTFNTCTFAGGRAYWGGAVHFQDFIAIFTDCYFVGNSAYDGGGLYLADGSIAITGGTIKGNIATGTNGYGIGGGLICVNTSATITDCVIEENSAGGDNPYGGGGAISFFGGDGNNSIIHRVRNCALAQNSTTVNGGAISCNAMTEPEIKNCTFDKNTADGFGGAIYIDPTSLPDIIHCIFANCTGHAIHEEDFGGNALVKYSLFYNNPDGHYYDSGIYDWLNEEYIVFPSVCTTAAQINALDSNPQNEGNRDGDPMFETGPLGEHYLNQSLSQAVDAGRDPAQNVWFLSPAQNLGTYTTDPNEFIFNKDSGLVDLGYHYNDHTDPLAFPRFELTVTVVGCDGDDCHGTVEYESGIDGTNVYYGGSVVQLEAIPNTGYRVDQWAGGTINDSSKSTINYVVMGFDKNITLQFEQPTVLHVPAQYPTIQHAIDAAVDGDTVMVATGTYRSSTFPDGYTALITIRKAITLTSYNPDDPDIVAATILEQWEFIFENIGNDTIVDGFTLSSNWTTATPEDPDDPATDGAPGGNVFGGAMIMAGASPTIRHCVFTDCSVTGGDAANGTNGDDADPHGGDGGWAGRGYGGAVYTRLQSAPIFEDCSFINCSARGGNGGNGGDGTIAGHGGRGGSWQEAPSKEDPTSPDYLFLWWDGWQYADPSSGFPYDDGFENYLDGYLKHSGYGGAVYCEGASSPRFLNCEFNNNNSYGGVCGIGGTGGMNTVPIPNRNLIVENSGGAVYAEDGSNLEFENCTFSNNSASPDPVYINNDGDEVTVTDYIDPYFSKGGAIGYTVDTTATLTNCTLMDNEASFGGAMYWSESGVTVADCNFIDNTAYHGAGLYASTSNGTITNSLIANNVAPLVVPDEPEDPEEPEEPEPEQPAVSGRGGGFFCFASLVDVIDSILTNNRAGTSGGAIYFAGSDQDIGNTPTLKNCLLTNNRAGRDGGAISANWYAEPKILNCTIANNIVTGTSGLSPGAGGGLSSNYYSNPTIVDSIIWANVGAGGAQLAVTGGDTYSSALNVSYSDIGPRYDPNYLTVGTNGDADAPGSGQTTGADVLVDAQAIYDEFDAGQDTVKVIVSLAEPVAMRQATDWNNPASAGAIRAEIAARQDAVLASLTPLEFTLRYRYENLAAFSGEITIDGLNQLLNNPSVAHIEPVRMLYICLAQGIPLINATEARQIYNGEGLAIAICDTGVDYTHPMLGNGGFPNDKVIGGYDFGDNDEDPMPNGDAAHGTCCAGLAAGDLGETGDYIGGVAHNAKIYALKISYQDTGGATNDAMIAGWDWCVTHKNDDPANPIMVTSTSFGGGRYFSPEEADAYSPAMKAAADNANAIGITVLASSGNDSFTDSLGLPAAISSVISVGAVYDTTDEVIGYSDTAYFLDVLAPSEDAYTLDIVDTAGYDPGDYYGFFDGTSAACPYAAGAVACLQSAALAIRGNYLTAMEVRNLLVLTGDPITDTKVNITKPRVNLGAAILNIKYGPPVYVEDDCTLNGRVFYDFDPNEFTWPADSNNIDLDPLFIGDYFLSQIEAGQRADSPCVNTGSKSASYLGMDTYTTRTDSGFDENTVDMGYHHTPFEPAQYKLTTTPINVGDLPDITVSIEPDQALYTQYTVVKLTVNVPPAGYQVKWTNTDDDTCTDPVNYVTMSSDKEVEVTYIGQYKLTVTTTDVEGLPSIVVTLDPDTPDGYYDQDTRVKLTVNNVPPNARVSWTGTDDDTLTEPVNYVTMDASRIVNVTYVPRYLLTVMPVDAEGLPDPDIEVTLDPESEDGYYDEDTQVTISITTPPAGYDISWAGTDNDASKNTTNYVTMDSDRTVYVTFQPTPPNTWTVPGDYPTIPIAIAAANDGDIITVGTGIYRGSTLVIDKQITLQASNPDDPDVVAMTIIDKAGYTGRSIWFTENAGPGTVVNGLTFVNGGGSTLDAEDGEQPGEGEIGHRDGYDGTCLDGGGIYCDEGSSPTIKNCVVMNAGLYGGNAGSGADADENNPAGRGGWAGWAKGGGIYVARDATPTFRNVTVTGCFAYGGNAGNGGNFFESATAYWPPGYGGNWNEEYPLIPGTWLWQTWGYEGDYRYYSGYGGGVYCDKGSWATFINCTITGNETRGGMSGIGGEFPSGVNEEPVISFEIPSYGGGVYCAAGSTTEFINCTIANNTAAKPVEERYHLDPYLGHGGGIAFEETASITFINCDITENEASVGGGMYLANDLPQIADCNFIDNLAYQGGGLYATRGAGTIDNCFIARNFAGTAEGDVDNVSGQGAGIYYASTATDILNCRIDDNEASASGGGIFLTGTGTDPTIGNCLIINNEAWRDGGGISVNWYAEPLIANCTVHRNVATAAGDFEDAGFGGGLYCSYDSNSVVIDSIFWDNTAYGPEGGEQIAVRRDHDPCDPCAPIATLTVSFSDIKSGLYDILVDPRCNLQWWDPLLNEWHNDSHNIYADPCFVGDYYLSQTAAGQDKQSPCVNAGSDPAANICFGSVCLSGYTTRTDKKFDTETVDMGYHHGQGVKRCGVCDLAYDDLSYNGIINLADFAVLTLYWLDDCDSQSWCEGVDLLSDGRVGLEDLTFFAECWLVETDNPLLDPAQAEWQVEPYANSDSSITMTAVTTVSGWSWAVEYKFEELSSNPGATDSGWQDDTTYEDTGLSSGQEYCYRVRARTKTLRPHLSDWSQDSCAIPQDVGHPIPVEWAAQPHGSGVYAVEMIAQTATDPEGHGPVEYYFACIDDEGTGTGDDSGWQAGTTYTDSGLIAGVTYTYRFKVRDGFNPPNESPWSEPALITLTLPPYPSTGIVGDPALWDPASVNDDGGGQPREVWYDGGWHHYMRADTAIDPEGATTVYYYFTCVDGQIPDSGWQTEREWITPQAVPQFSPYKYSVKYGDAPDGGSVSESSETLIVQY